MLSAVERRCNGRVWRMRPSLELRLLESEGPALCSQPGRLFSTQLGQTAITSRQRGSHLRSCGDVPSLTHLRKPHDP